MRYRKSSHNLSAPSENPNHGHFSSRDDDSTPRRSAAGPPLFTRADRKDSAQFLRFASPEISFPEVVRSGPGENTNVASVKRAPGVSLLRSFSVDQARSNGEGLPRHRGPSRTWTTPPSETPLSTEPVPATITPKDDQAVKQGVPRWRLLPFFRGDSSHTTTPVDPAPTSGEHTDATASSTTCKPRKGDVVCLGYDTLDDKAMRRLEGRSDHRPVIGSFAIYL